MTVATTNLVSYEIYGFQKAWMLVNDDGDIVAVPVDKPNKITMEGDIQTISFEGGNTSDKVYLTTGFTLNFDADALSVGALAEIFANPIVTTSLPTGVASRYYGGTVRENTGITAGFRGEAAATKRIDGAQVGTVVVQIEVFAGTLTHTSGPELNTKDKSSMQKLQMAATQTTTDLVGDALPGVDTDGAFYAVQEMS